MPGRIRFSDDFMGGTVLPLFNQMKCILII